MMRADGKINLILVNIEIKYSVESITEYEPI